MPLFWQQALFVSFGGKIKVNLRTIIKKSWSVLFKEWSLIIINVALWYVTSRSEIYWNYYQEENKKDCKSWVCRSKVKARNTVSHDPVVEFNSSPNNLSYFSGCPTSYLNLHLVINVAAQNYNSSHWIILLPQFSSMEIFLKSKGKKLEKLALDYIF